MKFPTASEALFSIKCFVAAMLALWISVRIDLPRPFWAVMTSYIVAAPFSAPTRSKASYRALGTIVGAVATTFAVPQLANAPELLSLAIALWIGTCLYVSLLDRTPRSYLMMLAGYTAALIAFPTVGAPGTIFDVALARVEEILIGIICATLVHSLVLPQSFGPVLLARLDRALGDAQHWITDALAITGRAPVSADRRTLAGDITELRVMATHLPFDTSHLRWTSKAVHALQDRLAAMVPLLSAIEDRLKALRELGALDETSQWRAVLDDITAWTSSRRDDVPPDHEAQLHKAIDARTPQVTGHAGWRTLLEVNLAMRLHALVDLCVECQTLRRHIDAGVHDDLPPEARQVPVVPTSALHLDHGLALMSALAAIITTLACCAFWIMTGWPAGAGAPMMAAVLCSFFATQDDPVPFIKDFLKYTLYSLPVGALYVLVLLPAAHNFETLVLVCAPVFLVLGVYVGRPSTFGMAMPFLIGIMGTLALQDTNSADLVSFTNTMLAQVLGLSLAAVLTGVLRTVGAGWTARRLLRAGWSELALLGSGERVPSVPEFAARMVDRIALLTPRLAHVSAQRDLMAADAMVDLRIGLDMARLQGARPELGSSEAALWPLFEHLAQHFEARPALDRAGERRLLASLDNALRSVCSAAAGAPRTDALAALAGIRRDMFPGVAPYQPAPNLEKEIR